MKGAAIISLMKSIPEIVDKLGDDGVLRVFPREAPRDVKTPYGTYRKILNTPTNSFTSESGFDFARYDLHIYSPIYGECEQVIELMRKHMAGASGTFAGVELNYTEYIDDSDDFNPTTDLHEHQIEFNFNYRRQP